MDGYIKLPKKNLMRILGLCAALMLLHSFEVMFLTKDSLVYTQWLASAPAELRALSEAQVFAAYLNVQLSRYFIQSVVPVMLSIHAYFAHTKLRINRLFVFVWGTLIAGQLAYYVSVPQFQSVIFYISLMMYGFLIHSVVSLYGLIQRETHMQKVG